MVSKYATLSMVFATLIEGSMSRSAFLQVSFSPRFATRKKSLIIDSPAGYRVSDAQIVKLKGQMNPEYEYEKTNLQMGSSDKETDDTVQNPFSSAGYEKLKSPNQIPFMLANSKCVPNQMSPTALAYIGDVVYEMCIRCRYVWPTRRTSDLQNIVVAKVRAETQSIIFLRMQSSFPLTKEEQVIVSRGRNAGSPKKKSRGPKRLYQQQAKGTTKDTSQSGTTMVGNQGPAAYQDSTALEALIGYLYLSDGDRCNVLLEFINNILDEMDEYEGISR